MLGFPIPPWDSQQWAPPEFDAGMTLTRFVTKSAFRNKRRSTLTVLSITFSLLLLTIMMTVWRAFYIDKAAPNPRSDWSPGTAFR